MKFHSNLYIGEELRGREDEMIAALKSGRRPFFLYILAFSSTKDGQLDLFSSKMLSVPGYAEDDMMIVGLAAGKEDGLKLIRSITEETFAETGTCDIRSFLISRSKE